MTLSRSLIGFAMSGLLATSVHVVIASGLIELRKADPVVANGVAFCCATALSYLTNSRWSFAAPMAWRTAKRYLLVAAVAAGLTMLIAALAERFFTSYWVGIALVVIVVPPVSYLMHRFFTFRDAL